MKVLLTTLCVATLVCLAPSESKAQELGEKVYWMATAEVPIANLAAFHEYAGNTLLPLQERHGYNFIVVWQTIVGDIEEVVMVAEFEKLAAYHEARVSLLGSEAYAASIPRFNELARSLRLRFLGAAPYSALQ